MESNACAKGGNYFMHKGNRSECFCCTRADANENFSKSNAWNHYKAYSAAEVKKDGQLSVAADSAGF